MYVQCIIKYILSYPDIAQNTLHGLLLQILFIAKAQSQSENHTVLNEIIADFMNHIQDIVLHARLAFVRWTFLEVGLRRVYEG